MSEPKRIQRKRTKGWRLPENTVIVTRPGKWGNPFKVGSDVGDLPYAIVKRMRSVKTGVEKLTPEMAIEAYRLFLTENFAGRQISTQARKELRGKNLACWCKPGEMCHADVLLELANKDEEP